MESRSENPFRIKPGRGTFKTYRRNDRFSTSNNNNFKNTGKKFDNRNWKRNSLLTQTEKFDPEKAIENSTPWHQLKEGLSETSQKTNENDQVVDNQSKQEIEKTRQQNHRKFLMQEKRKEPVQWERFSPERNIRKSAKSKAQQNNIELTNRIIHNKERFVKNCNLTPKENDYMRKVITKTTMMAKDLSIPNAIYSMENRGVVLKRKKVDIIVEQPSKKKSKKNKLKKDNLK